MLFTLLYIIIVIGIPTAVLLGYFENNWKPMLVFVKIIIMIYLFFKYNLIRFI